MGQVIKKAQFKKPPDKSQVFALARYEVSVVVEPRAKKTTGAAGEWLASNTSAICFSAGLALVFGSSKDVREWLWELAQGNVDGDPESSAHLRPGQKEWESARAVLWESVLGGEEMAPSLIQLEVSARICLDGKWRPALVMWRKGCILKTKGGTAKGSERAKKMIEAMPKKMASKAKELGLVFEELDFDDLMSDDWGACACARAGVRLEEFEINKALGEGKRARQDGQTQEWARL